VVGRLTRIVGLGLAVAAAMLAALVPAAWANTITVTSTADTGPGTIRAALAAANDGDTIAIPRGTYDVTSADLLVTKGVTIRGAAAHTTHLVADNNNRIFDIAGGSAVTIAGVSMEDADADAGGAIRSHTPLTLDAVQVSNSGAGITGGGALWASKPTTITRSTFADNAAFRGGALLFADGTGDVQITNSTFFSNRSTDDGGAIYEEDGTGPDNATTVTVANVTASTNHTGFEAGEQGGFFWIGAYNTARYRNSIFDSNGASGVDQGPTCWKEPSATATSLGGNRFQGVDRPPLCDFAGPNDLVGDIQAGPFQYWGGPTDTMRISTAKIAVDADPADENCPATDQRGVPRPQRVRCDAGAYELSQPTGSSAPPTGVTSTTATFHGTVNTQGLAGTVTLEDNFGVQWGQKSLAPKLGPRAVSFAVKGLQPATTYHMRLRVTSVDGLGGSGFQTFRTRPNVTPAPVRCEVPNLRGLTLKTARRELNRAHCRLGKVRYRHSGKARRHPVVVKQSPRAFSVRAAGTKVNVTLSRRRSHR
jgi:predicted outer membrane repeat protein